MLGTVLSAVDIGYPASDEGHDALMKMYHCRFSEQIETTDAETLLASWH